MEVQVKKQNIIKKSNDFNRIITKRNGKANKYFIINKEKNNDNISKFGITFVKKFGNAVTRNKMKRRIKSIIDNNKKIYQNNQNYIIIIRKEAINLPYKELSQQLINLFTKLRENNYEKK